MLADISDLSAAVSNHHDRRPHLLPVSHIGHPSKLTSHRFQDQKSANAMVSANKTLPTNPSQPGDHLKPPTSTPAGTSRPAPAPNRFDKFGRKILTPPAMSRTNSSTGSPSQNPSMPGTPRVSEVGCRPYPNPVPNRFTASEQTSTTGVPADALSVIQLDDEVQQASRLMRLYEIRNQLKQQDSTGLKKAREQIDALIAKNKHQTSQQGDAQKAERPGQISRTYTYPRTTSGPTTANTSTTK